MRRSAGPDFGSPPPTAPAGGGGYFPHDLDDIYESQADHQYFTHTGASGQQQQRPTAISTSATTTITTVLHCIAKV